MFRKNQYVFNKETLSYEAAKTPVKTRLLRVSIVVVLGLALFIGCYYVQTNVLGKESIKSLILENRNAELLSKLEMLNQKLDEENNILLEIQMRDNIVYRPIFGMDEISAEVRNAGFGGVDRYSHLEQFKDADIIISSVMKMDILAKKAYIQSRSFDEVSILAKRAGDMASCVPTIYPVSTASRNRMSSSFGYRSDPFLGNMRMHSGIDISGLSGEPIYATGDGMVTDIVTSFLGYGNYVIIDHGFGYKTRYAHLKESTVKLGQIVSRGDQIGKMGNSGRSKGTHLHYEVIYKGKPVNPWNYFTTDLTPDEYQEMIENGKTRG
ncbi:MAG: M23 family metallopeptidase [Bacteroidales bacterium]|nr:M23 family metallopeptidase [Bacteroidales bacterium]MDD4669512.1 M23 family metallopeptidase [Bacteroidales bacterium]